MGYKTPKGIHILQSALEALNKCIQNCGNGITNSAAQQHNMTSKDKIQGLLAHQEPILYDDQQNVAGNTCLLE